MEIPVSYDKSWKLLIDILNCSELKDAAGISFKEIVKPGCYEIAPMKKSQRIIQVLSRNIGKIMDFIGIGTVEYYE